MMMKRVLGKSGIEVSAMGLGCWAIGGPFYLEGIFDGYGNNDDKESIRAIKKAIDFGVTFFDTADCYGCGHSEQILGQGIAGQRDKLVIATKFGYFFNEGTKSIRGYDISPAYIERACAASLKRLNIDYIDLFQLHVWSISEEEIPGVIDGLESLVKKGLIRTYGWSTDLLNVGEIFASKSNCSVIQHAMNVFNPADELISLCEKYNLGSICRSPLAMGLLTGKFNADTKFSDDDVRGNAHGWLTYFKDGKPVNEFINMLNSIKEILTSNGRSLAQGSLAYIWGKNSKSIPIPGFKSEKQVVENAGAMEYGPLSQAQIEEIDKILQRGIN